MNNGEYFKIETIEELKEAYKMFKDEWSEEYPLDEEINMFSLNNYRYIFKSNNGYVMLVSNQDGTVEEFFKEIPSPLKKQKEKSSLQKTLEIGDLNIQILKALTANDIVDSSLTGQKAQNIVDKIDELSRIILK